ncbi:helix-turn-helix domain-containing protein [Bradyrhizobium manausense]|uniref:helix-turn-helix domain-containing protein n=1 Tax=Bradyrhizobium manausense TaxID=989370 RepID=UPI001BAB04AE|nr:helix-turn-helix domain-containing protein [Bradyrhizobium manausense]MBR0721776.1 helix-turn-helix domain-containing protein [Bradyrhizobium manausense]
MAGMNTSTIDIDDDYVTDRTRVRAKWGIAAAPGFGTFPVVMMANQAKLGLDVYEFNVLMHLVAHWHAADRAPFPHSRTIAKRMGLGIRKIQRCLKSLQDKGLIERIEKKTREDRLAYDLRPLVAKLDPLAREWLALRSARDAQAPTLQDLLREEDEWDDDLDDDDEEEEDEEDLPF